jgi:subtilisin family serine protease
MANFKMLPDYRINFQVNDLTKVNYNVTLHDVPAQWRITKGQGVKIAVLDTGVPSHKDLVGKVVAFKNFTDSPSVEDKEGHSTHCCGMIAADSSDPDNGITGIAPQVQLLVGKVISDTGEGNDEWLSSAIRWAVAQGADIISMSIGAPGYAEKSFKKTREAVLEAYSKNVFMFAAAGNEGISGVNVPGKWNEVFCVAAIDKDEKHAKFSNIGPEVDFSGVGVNVLSTYLNNQYASLSGTSMATPDIAAISALIISEHKSNPEKQSIKDFMDLRAHLIRLCTDLGESGYDPVFGWGNPVFNRPTLNLNPEDLGGIITTQSVSVQKSFWQRIKEWFNELRRS